MFYTTRLNEGRKNNNKITKRKPKRLKMGVALHGAVCIFLLFGVTSGVNNADKNNESTEDTMKHTSTKEYDIAMKDSRGLRMDYDKWKPLGRGDPLQNDPTYDYVPPVLERVHYWVDSPIKKQDTAQENKKSEILVLGVSSKKQSAQPSSAENRRDSYESFLKFIDGPKFHQHHNSFNRPNTANQRPPFFPQFYKNKFDDGHHKLDEQRVPYTVLVPPPIPPPHLEMPLFMLNSLSQQPSTTTQGPVYTPITTTTSSPSVTLQEANLIYFSSSTAKKPDWHGNKNSYTTNSWSATTENPSNRIQLQESESNVNKVTFRDSLPDKKYIHQNKPKAPIAFPTETGKIVFEHHSTITHPTNVATNTPNNVFFTKGPIVQPISSPPTTIPSEQSFRATEPHSHTITQMSVGTHMHKGQVSDDTIGNTYVNIGKPNAHIQQEFTTDVPLPGPINVDIPTESSFTIHNSIGSTVNKPYLSTSYPHHINSIFLNRPIGNIPMPGINNILTINNPQPFHRRPHPVRDYAMHTMQKMYPPPPPTTELNQITSKKTLGFLHSILNDEVSTTQHAINGSLTSVSSTTPTPTTTVVTSLTTDPLFKHYKQPVEPLKGPMYLIIQGHSKVKTYGPTNKQTLHDLSMTENNEIPKSDEYSVKHLHSLKDMLETNDELEQISKSRSKNARTLKDLINDGVGTYDLRETELGAGFEVSDEKTLIPIEKYHKGIVETDMVELRKLHKLAKIREKRQIEELLPVVEDTVESFVYDYLKQQSEGSGVGAVIATVITHDSSENQGINEINQNDDDDFDYDIDDILPV